MYTKLSAHRIQLELYLHECELLSDIKSPYESETLYEEISLVPTIKMIILLVACVVAKTVWFKGIKTHVQLTTSAKLDYIYKKNRSL